MSPDEIQRILERLAMLHIQLLPAAEITNHFVLERNGFVALIQRTEHGFGNIGAPGLLTPRGFAALVWRGEKAVFAAKGFETPASEEQVKDLREFARDVETAINQARKIR